MASICFVAGDHSGDTHAARLIESLKAKQPGLTFTGLGGPAMAQAGAALLDHLTKAAAIGPFDAAKHLARFARAKRLLAHQFATNPPSLVILVDFGDFNLPVIAPLAKRYKLPVLYYISPQLWAWGRWRLRYVRRYVDHMIVLFPFEETFYRREGIPVTWVGHPLVDIARPALTREQAAEHLGINTWRRIVGLLPGSRPTELAHHLPLCLEVARQINRRMPGVEFLLPSASPAAREVLDRALPASRVPIRVVDGPLYDALSLMEVALVASGTATLEAALCEVPMAVIYRTSWLTYLTARAVVRVPHIAMVNVLAGSEVVPEFVQHRAQPPAIAETLIELLRNEEYREQMKTTLRHLRDRLGPPGAVSRAADIVLTHLRS